MVKCRLIIPGTDDGSGRAILDTSDLNTSDEDTGKLERQLPTQQRQTARSDDDISDNAPVIDSDETVRSIDDPMGLGDEYFRTQFLVNDASQLAHLFPSLRCINQGILLHDTQAEKGKLAAIDETYRQYRFPDGNRNSDVLTDRDILGNFDP